MQKGERAIRIRRAGLLRPHGMFIRLLSAASPDNFTETRKINKKISTKKKQAFRAHTQDQDFPLELLGLAVVPLMENVFWRGLIAGCFGLCSTCG